MQKLKCYCGEYLYKGSTFENDGNEYCSWKCMYKSPSYKSDFDKHLENEGINIPPVETLNIHQIINTALLAQLDELKEMLPKNIEIGEMILMTKKPKEAMEQLINIGRNEALSEVHNIINLMRDKIK